MRLVSRNGKRVALNVFAWTHDDENFPQNVEEHSYCSCHIAVLLPIAMKQEGTSNMMISATRKNATNTTEFRPSMSIEEVQRTIIGGLPKKLYCD